MELHSVLQKVGKGLIVSCQAYPGDPMYGEGVMCQMALAAQQGGAVGIRASGADDIRLIKAHVNLPVIGIIKRSYPDSEVYITPTLTELKEIYDAGADMIALDATRRARPNGETLEQIVEYAKRTLGIPLMADISTLDEALYAESLGIDAVGPTLSGYTPYSASVSGPDWELIRSLVARVNIPVIAEGRIETPDDAAKAIEEGCHCVVVGTAITRPEAITARFVRKLKSAEGMKHV